MHHYGYLSEQLINGRLFPKKNPRRRSRRKSPGPAPSAAEGVSRLASDNAVTRRRPRVLVALYHRVAPR
jgi:hypothetical protein